MPKRYIEELNELKKILKEKSHSQLCSELGFRSPNTVRYWIEQNKIPVTAIDKVREYLSSPLL